MPESMILEALTAKDKGRQISIPPGGAVLGRGLDCEICLEEPTVSRKHCHILLEYAQWVIRDLGSRNGILVNGQKTSAGLLKQGDEITLGSLCLKVGSVPTSQAALTTDTIRFKCECGKSYSTRAVNAGQIVVCKGCGKQIKIASPAGRETGAEPAQESDALPAPKVPVSSKETQGTRKGSNKRIPAIAGIAPRAIGAIVVAVRHYVTKYDQVAPQIWLATKPTTPTELRVYGCLDNYYNFEFSDATHWSIRIRNYDGKEEYGNGYVLKESAEGKKLFSALQDGKMRKLVVVAACLPSATDGSVFMIRKIVNVDSWVGE